MARQDKVGGDIGSQIHSGSSGPMPDLGSADQLTVISEDSREDIRKKRKPGKRSDPAFRATTFFVRKDTQKKASRLLEDQESGKDLSDLVEELLAKWIDEHSHG